MRNTSCCLEGLIMMMGRSCKRTSLCDFLYIVTDVCWSCCSCWVNQSRAYPTCDLRMPSPVSCGGLRVACLCAGVKAVAVLTHSVPQCGRTHSSTGVVAVPGMLACERKGASALCGAALRQGARRGAQQSRGSAAVCRQHCCLVTFLGTLSAPGLWKLLKIFMPEL